ncbi:uncharacterized protein BX663DRAFT_559955 [Cokeromyces recurvatus]|uniref:uncharacterized protein n=1 Tax=Cokeromyces recurvatus TaxID=90255 RepID=UPI00221F96B3|nr:uncharacterized protein BX663DRAFT_559955 [Cokeromyces recurvatus]KAI7904248.1 hypothetical protein BX663DRAFT_559955 [Cokeromyces recurvatus]
MIEEDTTIKRPYLLAKSISNTTITTQVTIFNIHACNNEELINRLSSINNGCTQQNLVFQKQSSLVGDKNSLNHPKNVLQLTNEINRVNREYKSLKQYQDPLKLSMQRVQAKIIRNKLPIKDSISPLSSSSSSSASSSAASSYSSVSSMFLLQRHQRRTSSYNDYLMKSHNKDDRRHSLSSYFFSDSNKTLASPGFIGRFFHGSPINNQQRHSLATSHI